MESDSRNSGGSVYRRGSTNTSAAGTNRNSGSSLGIGLAPVFRVLLAEKFTGVRAADCHKSVWRLSKSCKRVCRSLKLACRIAGGAAAKPIKIHTVDGHVQQFQVEEKLIFVVNQMLEVAE